MKKIICLFLSVLLAALCVVPAFAAEGSKSFGGYDHVFIIGVDGAGQFFRDADTPNFDRIFADGAVDYTARTETIAVSAQNWGSILTGVSYLRHLMTNSSAAKRERDSSTRYPTIFKYVRDAYPDAELASIVNWNVINHGIIENDLGVYEWTGSDEEVTQHICEYFNNGSAPKLFFCHFDGVDAVGHELGSRSPAYYAEISKVDGYIGRIYDALEAGGLLENGLFIVVSDHGHLRLGGHLGASARESYTTVAVKGKTVVPGGAFDKNTRNRDVAAIALYALGIERPAHMSAVVPANLFSDVAGEKRALYPDLIDAITARFFLIITKLTALLH